MRASARISASCESGSESGHPRLLLLAGRPRLEDRGAVRPEGQALPDQRGGLRRGRRRGRVELPDHDDAVVDRCGHQAAQSAVGQLLRDRADEFEVAQRAGEAHLRVIGGQGQRREAAVATAEEQQGQFGAGGVEVLHLGERDLVVSGVVHGDRDAVDPGHRALDDRGAGWCRPPGDALEPLPQRCRRNATAHVGLVGGEDVDAPVACPLQMRPGLGGDARVEPDQRRVHRHRREGADDHADRRAVLRLGGDHADAGGVLPEHVAEPGGVVGRSGRPVGRGLQRHLRPFHRAGAGSARAHPSAGRTSRSSRSPIASAHSIVRWSITPSGSRGGSGGSAMKAS